MDVNQTIIEIGNMKDELADIATSLEERLTRRNKDALLEAINDLRSVIAQIADALGDEESDVEEEDGEPDE